MKHKKKGLKQKNGRTRFKRANSNILGKKRIQILLITAIFIVLGIIYTVGFVKPKYQSKTSLLLATNSSSQSNANGITTNDLTLNSKLVSTYSDMVSGNKIIREVIKI